MILATAIASRQDSDQRNEMRRRMATAATKRGRLHKQKTTQLLELELNTNNSICTPQTAKQMPIDLLMYTTRMSQSERPAISTLLIVTHSTKSDALIKQCTTKKQHLFIHVKIISYKSCIMLPSVFFLTYFVSKGVDDAPHTTIFTDMQGMVQTSRLCHTVLCFFFSTKARVGTTAKARQQLTTSCNPDNAITQ